MLHPGHKAPSGGTVFGGPFLLELEGAKPFKPVLRTVPPALTLNDYYFRSAVPVSIVAAAAAGLVLGDWHRFAETVMLLNPLVAMVGRGTSNLIANSRALRTGATVIHSRHDRLLRRPDVLLLDGLHLLTDGLEFDQVIPLKPAWARPRSSNSPRRSPRPPTIPGDRCSGASPTPRPRMAISTATWPRPTSPTSCITCTPFPRTMNWSFWARSCSTPTTS